MVETNQGLQRVGLTTGLLGASVQEDAREAAPRRRPPSRWQVALIIFGWSAILPSVSIGAAGHCVSQDQSNLFGKNLGTAEMVTFVALVGAAVAAAMRPPCWSLLGGVLGLGFVVEKVVVNAGAGFGPCLTSALLNLLSISLALMAAILQQVRLAREGGSADPDRLSDGGGGAPATSAVERPWYLKWILLEPLLGTPRRERELPMAIPPALPSYAEWQFQRAAGIFQFFI